MKITIIDIDGTQKTVPLTDITALFVRKLNHVLNYVFVYKMDSNGMYRLYEMVGDSQVLPRVRTEPEDDGLYHQHLYHCLAFPEADDSEPLVYVGQAGGYYHTETGGSSGVAVHDCAAFIPESLIDWKTSKKLCEERDAYYYTIVLKNKTRMQLLDNGTARFAGIWANYHGHPLEKPMVPMYRELWKGSQNIHVSDVLAVYMYKVPSMGVRMLKIDCAGTEKLFVEKITKKKFDMKDWMRRHNLYHGWFKALTNDETRAYFSRRRHISVGRKRREACE